ncbi:hypothetical protein NTE_02781 [Candidatus Nitrososphaera evergladensis SR1]|jgi:hypothetical protein|uniref:Transcriptional regulator n=1 Tax=Candidatus Nitrososphaera evergladensis SR1 TaxID=1459636 RepID=A0A075MW26_9ARCH|nr:hypothetical protein [Candidatus Nitrososphaera evergladensis]AIF84822.1 hypothetical protein NTE_02781 [Candidatus Nitrososphaera evergladensis SR1]
MDTPRELEWYLRDHFFRQAGKGRTQFQRSAIAGEMASLYLRYRGYDPQQLAESMSPVIDDLVSMQVLKQTGDNLEVAGSLVRMQCAKCFYVSYLLADKEPKTCQRCSGTELHEFPKRKQ